jgi:hypothetical protein
MSKHELRQRRSADGVDRTRTLPRAILAAATARPDVPSMISYGLRCGDVYYGPTSMTHAIYSWDATTMAGTLVSPFDAGCDGAPGTLTYAISLSRL